MAYLTRLLLAAKVGGETAYQLLTDDDGDEAPDPSVEAYLLAETDELLNGYARRGGYVTPLDADAVAGVLGSLLDIAGYKAKARRGKASEDDRKLFDAAMAVLESIGDGTFQLTVIVSPPATAAIGLDSEERLFTRATMRVY